MSFHFIKNSFKGLGVDYDCDHNRRVTVAFSVCECTEGECFGNRYCINYHRRRECGLYCDRVLYSSSLSMRQLKLPWYTVHSCDGK